MLHGTVAPHLNKTRRETDMYIRTQSHSELAGNTAGIILAKQYATLRDFSNYQLTRIHRPQDGDTFDTWPTRKSIQAGGRPIIYRWNDSLGKLVKLGADK